VSASLDSFNALPRTQARRALLACCSVARWAEQVAAARPYRSADAALRQSDEAVAGLGQTDLEEALAGHPRIGGRTAGAQSRSEQSGARAADPAILRALRASNEAYEDRFGHIYLVSATGKSAAVLLDILRARLANDPATEWETVRAELRKINRIRLRKLIEGAA
jgi:2-oxo-4-hydroxy-4-carboxy-5-ureidoimidazoline decarboxylase